MPRRAAPPRERCLENRRRAFQVSRWYLLPALSTWALAALARAALVDIPATAFGAVGRLTALSRRSSSRLRLRAETSGASGWAADWLRAELAKSPVLLIVESDGEAARDAKAALRAASVRFDALELERLGDAAVGAAVAEQLAGHGRSPGAPFLFVGGKLLPENFMEEGTKWLQQECFNVGAQFMEPLEATNMTWTVREGARWLPPKNIGGRRYYQDDAGMAKYADEHADAARIEYNELMAAPGGGTAIRSRISNPGQMLLRQDAKLDEPDKTGKVRPYAEWGSIDLLLRNDDGITDYLRSRDLKRVRNIKKGEDEFATQTGLPKDLLAWAYALGKKRLKEELDKRQCHHKVITCIDIQGLREALIEELQKEQVYSPTRQGVAPGIIQSLTAEEVKIEQEAESDVPLLVAVVNRKMPAFYGLRDELTGAAKLLLRAMRVVTVDGVEHPDIVRQHGIKRFPTLIWFQGRSGVELGREVGVFPASSIIERTRLLLQLKELPEPSDEATALLAKAGPPSRKFRKDRFRKVQPPKWATVRTINGASKGFWR